MRSFINEISTAEHEAEKIRQNAVMKAKDMISAAGVEAAETLEKLKEKDHQDLKSALEKAEADGETEAARLGAEFEEKADQICRKANEKLDSAVSYLLNKIQGLA